MKHLVFVYGTLKRGHGNNRVMHENGGKAELLGAYRTSGDHFVMAGNGFPMVSRPRHEDVAELTRLHKLGAIVGELWSADNMALANMDRLEGHPTFYERKQVRVVPMRTTDDLKPAEAWMYLIPMTDMRHRELARARADHTHVWTREAHRARV